MPIKELRGDALEVFESIPDSCLIHQVNCQGVMGSGIAKQIREKYPEHFDDYIHRLNIDARPRIMGDCFFTSIDFTSIDSCFDAQLIFGLFSQWTYGKGKHTNYAAFASALFETFSYMKYIGRNVAIIPKYIGCGLGGGDWSIVYPIIYDAASLLNINVILVEK